MVAASDDLGAEAVAQCLVGQGVGVDVKPGERLTDGVAVLHAVLQLAVVTLAGRQLDDAVLVLEDVADVRRVA